jgi:predicted dehydrogenase
MMGKEAFSRRDVVKAGCLFSAGFSAPYVITSAALGDTDTPPASDRITVGHIGVGGRGRALFSATRQVARAQSVAVADCYRDRRNGLAAVSRGKAYRDFRDLLMREDVDAVIVATPDHWHVPICELAADAGKHVYLEKPVGLTIQQNLRCQELFTNTGLVFQYGTQQRSMSHCHKACELVRRGAVGEIHTIEVDAPNGGAGGTTAEAPRPDGLDYDMWLGPAPETPYTADRCKPPGTYWVYDQSIGYLAGWGAHPLDLMVWGSDADLSGPITVEGSGTVPQHGLYDAVYNWDMRIKLGNVRLRFRPGTDRTKFIGNDGWIQVARSPAQTTASESRIFETKLDPQDNYLRVSKHHMGNFIDAVAAGDPQRTVTSIAESVRSDIISHLCDIAVRTGERISWDPAAREMIEGSQEARTMISRPARKSWML